MACIERASSTSSILRPARAQVQIACEVPRVAGLLIEERQGLPGFWVIRRTRAVDSYPAGAPPPRPLTVTKLLPSGRRESLGPRHQSLFEAVLPTAHTLAYLRIAGAVTGAVARLAADLPGSALVGQDFHLLDDFSDFQVSRSRPPFLSDQDFLVAPRRVTREVVQLSPCQGTRSRDARNTLEIPSPRIPMVR